MTTIGEIFLVLLFIALILPQGFYILLFGLKKRKTSTTDWLKKDLEKALAEEDYEEAAKIRDKIAKIQGQEAKESVK